LKAPPPGVPDWGHAIIEQLRLERDGLRVTLELPLTRREGHQLGMLPSKTEAQQLPGLPWLALAFAG
ncbi:MAG: hypothetical protein KDK70_24850, partial [Myxococcales bacterium]|nr:hypothetical protein [Myxococcales bacterium]